MPGQIRGRRGEAEPVPRPARPGPGNRAGQPGSRRLQGPSMATGSRSAPGQGFLGGNVGSSCEARPQGSSTPWRAARNVSEWEVARDGGAERVRAGQPAGGQPQPASA